MTDRELMQQALEALVESVDLVSSAYETDWRHGLPTRKAQLDKMKAGVEFHEATIAALRERLAREEPLPPPPECQTETEKAAYAFGWWKALETQRLAQDAKGFFDKARAAARRADQQGENT